MTVHIEFNKVGKFCLAGFLLLFCTFVSTKVPKTPTQQEGMAHSGGIKCKKANFDSDK